SISAPVSCTHTSTAYTSTLSLHDALPILVIEAVNTAWNADIRDGFGQTESTLQIANTPGQNVKAGSLGRVLPGYNVVLIDPATEDRKSTRLNSSHVSISYAVFCLKKKTND